MEVRKTVCIPAITEDFTAAFAAMDFDRLDELDAAKDNAWTTVYNGVATGADNIAWWDCYPGPRGYMRYALHKSPKQNGYLQLSVMEIRDGNMIPTSDRQYNKMSDFLCDFLPDGLEVSIA